MNKARKGPAFLVIFLMLLLIVAYIYAAYQTVKPARGLICNGVFRGNRECGRYVGR